MWRCLQDDCAITPVISESSANFIEGLVKDAEEKGATLCQKYKRENNLIWPVLIDHVNAVSSAHPFPSLLSLSALRGGFAACSFIQVCGRCVTTSNSSMATLANSASKNSVSSHCSWRKSFWSRWLRQCFFLPVSAVLLLQFLKRLCVFKGMLWSTCSL